MLRYLLYRLGQFLALAIPIKICYRLAIFFADLRFIFAYQDRKFVLANLKSIFPEKSLKEIRKIRRSMFRNFAKYLVDFFRFEKINDEFIKKNVTFENIHYVNETLKKGKGAILLTAHLGNWELGGVVTSISKYPLWAIALPHKHKRTNDFFNKQRESKGLKVIPLGKAVRQSLFILKKNNLLAVVGDKDFTNERGIVVDFLNRETSLPKGPAAFCLISGAPIIPGFMLRNPDDSFTLRFEKPIDLNKTVDFDEHHFKKPDETKMHEIAIQYKSIIESYVRKYPDQWYMFRPYWQIHNR